MHRTGIRACVEPSFWLGTDRRYAGTYFDYFQLILDFETVRARRFGIDHYAAVSVNPKEAENVALAREVFAGMDQYLTHPRCVALGEIGFNNITPSEETVFVEQLDMAFKHKLPIIIHLPHTKKPEGTSRILAILRATHIPEDMILIDHNTEDTMPILRDTGYYLGLTVYPISKLTPARVSAIIRQFGGERVLVNGSADWGISDPLSLVKVVEYLKGYGHSAATMQGLVFSTANAFYSHSPKWKPEPGLNAGQSARIPAIASLPLSRQRVDWVDFVDADC